MTIEEIRNFNANKYLKLLKPPRTLIDQGSFLFKINRDEYLELFSYRAFLQNQDFYDKKNEFINLVEEYLREGSGKDSADFFVYEFLALLRRIGNIQYNREKEIFEEGIQRLAKFSIDPKSTEFSDILGQIADDCDAFMSDPEDTYGMNLDQFVDSIGKQFLQMQQYLD